jgi:hypothetical protein
MVAHELLLVLADLLHETRVLLAQLLRFGGKGAATSRKCAHTTVLINFLGSKAHKTDGSQHVMPPRPTELLAHGWMLSFLENEGLVLVLLC